MLIAEGNRVRLVNTGDIGIITSVIDEDMVNVMLEDGFEIPVNVDDLRLANNLRAVPSKNAAKAKEEARKEALHPTIITNRQPNTNQGVFVGFETKYDYEGNPNKYFIYLINDNQADVVFNYEFSLIDGTSNKLNGLVKSNTAFPLGILQYDELNDSPQLYFELWASTTAGRGKKVEKTIKVKVKQFLKKIKKAPVLHGEVYLYELAIKLEEAVATKSNESLSAYTKKVSKSNQQQQLIEDYYYKSSIPSVKDKAYFPTELDLHIENLAENPKSLTNAEKLNLQIKVFEEYIDEAYRIGLDSVFIIHGLGKGRLRDIVSSRLIRNDTVKTFKNDYHPKYGFGATEVFFKK